MSEMKFKMGDYFFYIAKRKHQDYPFRQVLGKVTNVEVHYENRNTSIQTMSGAIVEEYMAPTVSTKVFYEEIYSNNKITSMDNLYFTAESPMGQHAVICTKEEIDLLKLFYE